MMKTRHDNNMTNLYVWAMLKSKLSFWDLFDHVCFVMKTRLDNNVINHIGAFHAKNDTESL